MKRNLWKYLVPVFFVMAIASSLYVFVDVVRVVPVTTAQRIDAANAWEAGLKEVYARTNDVELGKIIKNLDEHGIITEPKNNTMRPQVESKSPDDFYIVPMFEADATLTPWDTIWNKSSAATYLPEKKVMVLKNNEAVSPFFTGVVFAHELDHHLVNPNGTPNGTSKDFCEEEVKVHEYSNALILKAGGDTYQELLTNRAGDYNEYFHDPNPLAVLRSFSFYPLGINAVFGSALSDEEESLREMNLDIAAMFLAVDKFYDGDKEAQKATLMCQVYVNHEILPAEKK